jgi:hypothetical protein
MAICYLQGKPRDVAPRCYLKEASAKYRCWIFNVLQINSRYQFDDGILLVILQERSK